MKRGVLLLEKIRHEAGIQILKKRVCKLDDFHLCSNYLPENWGRNYIWKGLRVVGFVLRVLIRSFLNFQITILKGVVHDL